jgi:hypothetical protein
MTAEEAAVAALAEAAEFGSTFPTTRTTLYRRASTRQQQLFAMAAQIDPDWAGFCVEGDVVDGAVNLAPMLRGDVEGIPAAERVSRVHVNDPGTSVWSGGKEVAMVPSDDMTVGLPPRVTLRGGIFRSVGSDLDGVVSLSVYYSRRPAPVSGSDHVLEIPEPHADLIVYDLARSLVQKAVAIDAKVREHAVAYFNGQETAALAAFREYIQNFVSDTWRFTEKR